MHDSDSQNFKDLMKGVHSFYTKDLSEFALGVWWQALKPFDFEAVKRALNAHVVNPDVGQFMPKPADVVKVLRGRTVDNAMIAWSKVDRAVRCVGSYRSVAFDDPIIHRVIEDMGGWVTLGKKSSDEWPFVSNEFCTRYRGYAMRDVPPSYPTHLIGIAEASNNEKKTNSDEGITLIGNADRAKKVISHGGESSIAITHENAREVLSLEKSA